MDDARVVDGVLIASPRVIRDWRRGRHGLALLHELVHTASPMVHRDFAAATEAEQAMEEGVAEAVAWDLWPAWEHRFGPDDSAVVGRYLDQREWVLRVSAAATRGASDSWRARRWRWRLVSGDRASMLTALPPPLRRPPPLF
ncbi:MAG: hypothetical protein AB1416_08340 [Actinomycetota bacterium]